MGGIRGELELLSPEEQYLQSLSPTDAYRMTAELDANRQVSPEQASANRQRNLRDLLSIIPGPGNVIAAEDATQSFGDAADYAQEGRYGRAALMGGLGLLSGFGAVTGLPTGRLAGVAAKDANRTLNVGVKLASERPMQSAGYVDGMERVFHITDGDNVVGQIHGGLIAPDKFKIDWMQGVGDSANSFGPAKIREVMASLREHYPNLREIVGERGAGARKGTSKAYESVAVKLPGIER